MAYDDDSQFEVLYALENESTEEWTDEVWSRLIDLSIKAAELPDDDDGWISKGATQDVKQYTEDERVMMKLNKLKWGEEKEHIMKIADEMVRDYRKGKLAESLKKLRDKAQHRFAACLTSFGIAFHTIKKENGPDEAKKYHDITLSSCIVTMYLEPNTS